MTDEIPARFPQQSQSRGFFGLGERRPSPRSSSESHVCETCRQSVEPSLYNLCRGCNQYAHQDCQETMSIGVIWRLGMCMGCTNYVRQLLRIIRATEARRLRGWNEDNWFASVLDACNGVGTMPEADYKALNAVQIYIKDGIAGGLHVWQSHSLVSPTERGEPSPRPTVVIRGKSPSPTGSLLPAAPPQGQPVPIAGSESATAELGGRVPSKGSGPVPPLGKGSKKRTEVKEEEGAGGHGASTSVASECTEYFCATTGAT